MDVHILFIGLENHLFVKQQIISCEEYVMNYIKNSAKSDRSTPTITYFYVDNKQVISNEEKIQTEFIKYVDLNCLKKESLDQTISDDGEFCFNDFFNTAEVIHQFADLLESPCTELLYVFWCVEWYIPCPSEVLEFYGSLCRLQSWHGGSLFIVAKDSSLASEWPPMIPIQIINSYQEVIEDILLTEWRGSLGFKVEGNTTLESFPEVKLSASNSIPQLLDVKKSQSQGTLYVSPIIEAVCDIDLASVPWVYLEPGIICKLKPSCFVDGEATSNAMKLLQKLICRTKVGTLLRLRYSTLPPLLQGGVSSLTTKEWKKCIADGDFDVVPSFAFKSFHKSLSLLLIPEKATDKQVFAVILRDLLGQDVLRLARTHPDTQSIEEETETKNKVENLLKGIYFFNPIHMNAFSHLMLNLPEKIHEVLDRKNQSVSNLWTETKCHLEMAANQQILEHLLLLNPNMTKVLKPTVDVLPEIDLAVEEWSKYKALVEREAASQLGTFNRIQSGDYLAGIPPPPTSSLLSLNASLICKHFQPDGTAAQDNRKIKVIGTNKSIFKTAKPLDEAKLTPWPDALHSWHHGIHYNSSEKHEQFEERCSRFAQRCIREETAAYCCNQQGKIYSGYTKKDKTNKSSASKDPLRCNTYMSDSDSVSTRSGTRAQHRKTLASRGTTLTSTKHGRTTMPRAPLRRSPRKIQSKAVKPSDLLNCRANEKNNKAIAASHKRIKESSILSEAHKKKLRHAVLVCLESEKIKEKHPLFISCFRKLFAVCVPFVQDIIGRGSTSKNLENIAKAHVKQVIHFEKLKQRSK